MFTTLVAVIAALVLGHVAPALARSLREHPWYARWLLWLGSHPDDGGLWCKKPSSCPPSPDVLTRFGNNKPPHRQMY